MKLYELTNDSLLVVEQLLQEDQLDEDGLQAALDAIGEAVEQKLDGIARLIRNWEAETEALHDEIARLRDRQSAIDNRVRRLKDYALQCLQRANLHRVRLPIVTAYIGRSTRVEVDVPPEEVPEQYRRISVSVDKRALKEALDAGDSVPGARLAETEYLVLR
jgi:chromosome segregation ATPase